MQRKYKYSLTMLICIVIVGIQIQKGKEMSTQHDVTKLPKWAQELIADQKDGSVAVEPGTNIENCHFENNAVKHDKHTVKAIKSVADALGENAEALGDNARALQQLARTIVIAPENITFESSLHLGDKGKS